MTSNFGRSYLLRLNSDLGVLGLHGNPIAYNFKRDHLEGQWASESAENDRPTK